jgi:hypothetical protein
MTRCYVTDCVGAAQWQMGLHVWPVGADINVETPELIAMAFTCCEIHRLNPPAASTLLPEQAQGLVQGYRQNQALPVFDFSKAQVVFRQYITNGGAWHR